MASGVGSVDEVKALGPSLPLQEGDSYAGALWRDSETAACEHCDVLNETSFPPPRPH
jgi:hypothetical protein